MTRTAAATDVDAVMASVCDAAVRSEWETNRGEDERLRVAILIIPAENAGDTVQLSILAPGATARQAAEFRMAAEGLPWCMYEVRGRATLRAAAKPADVVVGFRSARQVTLCVELATSVPNGGGVLTTTYCVSVGPTELLTSACFGVTPLPLIAMPSCMGISVSTLRNDGAGQDDEDGRESLAAICALLRADVQKAVAACRFEIPREAEHAAGMLIPLCRDGGRKHTLPDLGQLIDRAAARARASHRHGVVFKEMMERVWSPRRVASGAVDPDWTLNINVNGDAAETAAARVRRKTLGMLVAALNEMQHLSPSATPAPLQDRPVIDALVAMMHAMDTRPKQQQQPSCWDEV